MCLIQALLLTSFIFSAGCEAPRNNPFDPGSVSYLPPKPPAPITDLSLDILDGIDCLISWTAPAKVQEYRLYFGDTTWTGTDQSKAVLFRGELPGVNAPGTLQTHWITVPPVEIYNWMMFSISADSLISAPSNILRIEPQPFDRPAIINPSVRSTRIARWSNPLDQLSLDFNISVADSDGVDSVWVEERGSYLTTLNQEGNTTQWTKVVLSDDLPDGSVENMVGHDLYAYCLDQAGFIRESPPFRLNRVIADVPIADSPADNVFTGQFPTLNWSGFDVSYDYTFSIQIVHISEAWTPTTVFIDSLISRSTVQYQVPEELTEMPQYLLWSVWTVDEFGNRCRSRQASFRITDHE